MLAPLLLILLATLTAALGAYGTHPNFVQYPHGLDFILFIRRIQWPLFGCSIVMCVALFALIASGKRRIFWLIGLAPVLALFFHRFHSGPMNAFAILDNPPFIAATDATFLADDDWIVGLKLNDQTYAYPYSTLYVYPAIVQADHDQRIILLWSAFANHAAACKIDRDVKASELEIVSFPANALLLYNSHLGEFVNGITLSSPSRDLHGAPHGFNANLPTTKTTWKTWRTANPNTKVLAVIPPITGLPRVPVLPYYPTPSVASDDTPAETRIAVLWTQNPLAILSSAIPTRPLNLTAGKQPILLFRDKSTGLPRAFDRTIDQDLSPQFRALFDPARPAAAFIDVDTQTGWSTAGAAVDGDPKFRTKKLAPVPVEDDLYWAVMKYWLPDLKLHPRQATDPEPDLFQPPNSSPHVSPSPARRRRH